MSSLPPDPLQAPPALAAHLGPRLYDLAQSGVYLGTSSWKYDGWLGQIYTAERYLTRGKFSNRKFEDECLTEYAETFPTVCADLSFYQFPTVEYWARLFGQSPPSLSIAAKVPEDITCARWPGHARYGQRAGQDNEHFLDAKPLRMFLAERLRPYGQRVGPLIFEFGTFPKAVFPTVDDFVARLGGFLPALPEGFRYAIEIRNPEYLTEDYFALLRQHNVAHIFNAWTRMPALSDQIEIPGAYTADFAVVRALLTKGRTYEAAVKTFEPYKEVQQPNPSAREAMGRICGRSIKTKEPAFIYVNNRLEGSAPYTIEAVLSQLGGS